MTDDRKELGQTGIAVGPLAFGGMVFRGPPKGEAFPATRASRILNLALDLGVDLIDTSIDYGPSESLIGRFLAHRRGEFVIASKCGCLAGWEPSRKDESAPHDFSRQNIVAGVESSLRRLRTDYLDILQVHMSPSRQLLEREGVIDTLDHLRSSGKIRVAGISSTLPNAEDHIAMDDFEVIQMPYSIHDQQHDSVMLGALDERRGVLIRGVMRSYAAAGADRNDALESMLSVAPDLMRDLPARELVLRFAISHPAVSSAIVGTLDPTHLLANVEAARKGPLPIEVWESGRR